MTSMRNLFSHLLYVSRTRCVPIVIHNGLLDLMFLYHAFHADLPSELPAFTADLSEMFPGGIYDTKYVADYVTREHSSFLAYLFRKYEREQARRNHNAISHNDIDEHKDAGKEGYTGMLDKEKVNRQRCFVIDIKDRMPTPVVKTHLEELASDDAITNATNNKTEGSNVFATGRKHKRKGNDNKLYCEQYAVSPKFS